MDAYGHDCAGSDSITSRSNSLVKRARGVLAGKERQSLILEGERLIADALLAGWRPDFILRSTERPAAAWEAGVAETVRVIEPEVLAHASALDTSPGWLAVFPRPGDRKPDELELGPSALVLVVCGVQDPGNLGALARSLEASGGELLITLDGGAGPWNAKALRGSMGSLLRLPHHRAASSSDIARELGTLGFRSVCATTRGGVDYRKHDWSGRIALWVASESGELPTDTGAFDAVSIPMAEGVESLNVTVAASLLLFAAGRVGAS